MKWEKMLEKMKLPLVGALFGLVSVMLVSSGNPGNMGLCVACFVRDTGGAIGLHNFEPTQYVRPEIIGMILGALIVSISTKEFAAKGGSAPITRFALGAAVMIGALIFLGCPTRMLLRIAGGDLNAIVGLVGFAAGISGGMFFLHRGFSLKRAYSISKTDAFILPMIAVLLLVALLFVPSILNFTEVGGGPGGARAPIAMALGIGLLMGGIGFVSRFCFVAGIRDSFFFKNFSMLGAFVALLVIATIGNIVLGQFNLGFESQPVAHTDGVWNFLGLGLVGFGSVLLGGCPLRQVILAGSGNADSVAAVFGLTFGAALAHNFSLASSPVGIGENAPVAFVIATGMVLCIAIYNTYFNKKERKNV